MNKKITKIIIMLFMVMVFLGVSKNADAKDKYVTERGVIEIQLLKGFLLWQNNMKKQGRINIKL